MITNQLTLPGVLVSDHRSLDIPDSSDLYGWLVGQWQLDVLHYWGRDVCSQGLRGEVHAAWILEGRAIQDVWIMPPRPERSGDLDPQQNMFGTTLRVWDGTNSSWRIAWFNPAGDHYEQQVGRPNGKDIVQLGVRPDGTVTRWRFTEIASDSFHWLGEALQPDGRSWALEGEFRATRLSGG